MLVIRLPEEDVGERQQDFAVEPVFLFHLGVAEHIEAAHQRLLGVFQFARGRFQLGEAELGPVGGAAGIVAAFQVGFARLRRVVEDLI